MTNEAKSSEQEDVHKGAKEEAKKEEEEVDEEAPWAQPMLE